jgi:pimeloyl-ACP methyl ester carboxylesterase
MTVASVAIIRRTVTCSAKVCRSWRNAKSLAAALKVCKLNGDDDKNIPAEALGFMAQRAGSQRTVVVEWASHVVMISKPKIVADVIENAAQ